MTGRKLVLIGDNIQMGLSPNIENVNCINSPSIEYSMRSGNSTVKDNVDSFRVLAKTLDQMDYKNSERPNIPSKFRELLDNIKIKHGKDPQGLLTGHKIEGKA
jgi:hypothetical protein